MGILIINREGVRPLPTTAIHREATACKHFSPISGRSLPMLDLAIDCVYAAILGVFVAVLALLLTGSI